MIFIANRGAIEYLDVLLDIESPIANIIADSFKLLFPLFDLKCKDALVLDITAALVVLPDTCFAEYNCVLNLGGNFVDFSFCLDDNFEETTYCAEMPS